jgi:Pyruvate/2-oxoacid:ferredoxin oxidoreductase delta subunit
MIEQTIEYPFCKICGVGCKLSMRLPGRKNSRNNSLIIEEELEEQLSGYYMTCNGCISAQLCGSKLQ